MTTSLAEHRKKLALRWTIAAFASLAVAVIALAIAARSADPNRVIGPVVSDLRERIGEASRITVTSRDAVYRIQRTERGWAMTDRGDFPVRAQRLAQLTEGLASLQRVRRMTDDPDRHERLGVSDPSEGGNGILVQIENAQGALIVNLILGVERTGTYAREPGENQVWAVTGDLPPLREPAAWLDLQPLDLPPARIQRAEIVPAQGPPYTLERQGGPNGDFAFTGSQAGQRALSSGTLTTTAERIAMLQPVDVLPASAVQGAPAARLRVLTTDNVLIDAEIIRFEERAWLKFVARPQAPGAQAAADPINARGSAWAYALSDAEYDALVPTLGALTFGQSE